MQCLFDLFVDEVWKTERKILNKLFKSHRLDEYVTLFQKHAEKLVETLKLQNTPDIDLWCTFNQCALSVVYGKWFSVYFDFISILG